MAKRRRSPVENETVEAASCSYEVRRQIVRALPFLSSLDDQAITAIVPSFREKGFSPGAIICFSHTRATHFYVVASGLVKLVHQTEEGRNVILDVLSHGEFFGRFPGSARTRHSYSAQTLTSTCTLAVPTATFQKILENHPAVVMDLLETVSDRLEFAQARIRALSVDPVEKRVARSLTRLATKFGVPKEVGLLIQLPLSREDLADMSGTTTETASRIVSELRRAGIIRTGRRWIAIRDREQLATLAGADD